MPYPSYISRVPWPMTIDQSSSSCSGAHQPASAYLKRSTSPLENIDTLYDQSVDASFQQQQQHQHQHQPPFIPQWPVSQPSTAHLGYSYDNTYPQQFSGDYSAQYQASPTNYMPTQPQVDPSYQMDGLGSFNPLGGQMGSMSLNWQSFQSDLVYPVSNGLPNGALQAPTMADHSPTDNYLEARSLTSNSSNDWVGVDLHEYSPYQSLDAFQNPQTGAISNPGQALHGRTFSDSSYSDGEQRSQHSWSSFVEVPPTIGSPCSDEYGDLEFFNVHARDTPNVRPSPPAIVTSIPPRSMTVKKSMSPQRSPISAGKGSPPTRRQSRKNTSPKTTKSIIQRRPVQPPKSAPETSEKKIGRRKGPLRPEQRKQASEIRKLGACLRCKFLKKTVSFIDCSVRMVSNLY